MFAAAVGAVCKYHLPVLAFHFRKLGFVTAAGTMLVAVVT